jgi:hypothetical protein
MQKRASSKIIREKRFKINNLSSKTDRKLLMTAVIFIVGYGKNRRPGVVRSGS